VSDHRHPLVVGIGGTARPGSGTERVLRAALDAAADRGARTLLVAGPDLALPMYAPGDDARSPAARRLVDAVARADAVVLASPAYHGTMSGLVKNALDHLEDLRDAPRPYLDGRAVGCVACAGGPQAAAATLASLRAVAHALRGWPTPLGIAVDTSATALGAGGELDPALLGRLDILAEQVVGFARMRAAAAGRRHGERLRDHAPARDARADAGR